MELSSEFCHGLRILSSSDASRKGAMQPVLISVKARQGRKTVTLISGLETFAIDLEDFAEELKKLCAGSTTSRFLQRFTSFKLLMII
jgi:translation initiation factor 1 (eIF-1/SUI1)